MSAVGYLGDGRLFCLTNGANLQYLCQYDGAVFFGLSCGLSVHSEEENGIFLHRECGQTIFDGMVQITDLIADAAFLRQCESTKALTYHLHLPIGNRILRYPDLRVNCQNIPLALVIIPQGTPKPEGGCTESEARLLIAIAGDGEFTSDPRQIRLLPGRCTLICCLGKGGDELSRMKKILSQTDLSLLCQSPLFADCRRRHRSAFALGKCQKKAFDALVALTGDSGGVISGHTSTVCHLCDQIAAARAFLHLKRADLAVKAANFLLFHLNSKGYLPLFTSAVHLHYVCEKTDREWMLYPDAANLFLDIAETLSDANEKKRLTDGAKTLLRLAEQNAKTAGFGFSGDEFPFRKNTLSPERLPYGNGLAYAEYLYLRSRLKAENSQDYAKILAHFHSDFPQNAPISIDSFHRLGRLRQRESLYGSCPICREDARYIGWLMRGKYGTYLCPNCYAKGQRELPYDSSPTVLWGSYVYMQSRLQKAGLLDIRRLCHALDRCLELPNALPPSAPFYECALLAIVMKDLGDPRHGRYAEGLEDAFARLVTPSAYECALYLLAQAQ